MFSWNCTSPRCCAAKRVVDHSIRLDQELHRPPVEEIKITCINRHEWNVLIAEKKHNDDSDLKPVDAATWGFMAVAFPFIRHIGWHQDDIEKYWIAAVTNEDIALGQMRKRVLDHQKNFPSAFANFPWSQDSDQLAKIDVLLAKIYVLTIQIIQHQMNKCTVFQATQARKLGDALLKKRVKWTKQIPPPVTITLLAPESHVPTLPGMRLYGGRTTRLFSVRPPDVCLKGCAGGHCCGSSLTRHATAKLKMRAVLTAAVDASLLSGGKLCHMIEHLKICTVGFNAKSQAISCKRLETDEVDGLVLIQDDDAPPLTLADLAAADLSDYGVNLLLSTVDFDEKDYLKTVTTVAD